MSELQRTRSMCLEVGDDVVVEKEGKHQGQKGVVASKVQGWIKVHIDGEEGVSNFHAADLKVVETTSVDSNAPWNEDASPLEKIASPSNKNASPKRKKSPIVKASAPSPAEVAAKSVAENSSISSTSFGTDLDPGLPPRHPTTLSSTEIGPADESAAKQTLANGNEGDSRLHSGAAATPSRAGGSDAASIGGGEDRSTDREGEGEEEDRSREFDAEMADAVDGEAAAMEEEEDEDEVDGEETEADEIDGGKDDDSSSDDKDEEDEEEEIDIEAMVKLAAAAAWQHASAMANGSGRGSAGSAVDKHRLGSASSSTNSSVHPHAAAVGRNKRPRGNGGGPTELDSGLASPKYLRYDGTGKGKTLTASVSMDAMGGGKTAKLMSGSALYSGRDRAMLLERTKAPKDDTAGKGWFNMEQAEMTPELKRDLQVIRMRNYVDPKRFYKSSDKVSKFMQIGTVKEGPAEYFSSRLTNKERKSTLVDELLVADDAFRAYSKNQYGSIQSRKRAGGKAHYNEQRRKMKGGMKWKP